MLSRTVICLFLIMSGSKLVAAPPEFSPEHGVSTSIASAGTVVTVTGSAFTHATQVKLNGVDTGFRVTDLSVATSGFQVLDDATLMFIVPFGAQSGRVTVLSPKKIQRSVIDFVVAPRITSFRPAIAAASGIVSVSGANFNDINSVLLNGVSVGPRVIDLSVSSSGFQIVSRGQLNFRVPADAVSGKIELINSANDSVVTSKSLGVKPAIQQLAPLRGTETVGAVAGTIVTISGTGFSDATAVKLNGLSVGPRVPDLQSVLRGYQVISSQSIAAIIPANATSGKLTVSNNIGTSTSPTSFTVDPRIVAVTPLFGIVGSPVVMTGKNLDTISSVFFGDVAVGNTLQVISNREIRFNVPEGAKSGRIIVYNAAGGTASSAYDFNVVNTLTDFSPASGFARSAGVPGTMITVRGTEFSGAAEVLFGGISAGNQVLDLSASATGFQIVSDTELLARVPAGAETGPITVRLSRSDFNSPMRLVGISGDAFVVLPATASLSLPAFFNDNMVLQRGVPVPVWGNSPAGSEVSVSFGGQQKSSIADEVGNWRVLLDPLAVTESDTLQVSNGLESIAIANVAVGDVWLCAGQSNMAFPVRFSETANETMSGSEDSLLRIFRAGTKASVEPQSNVSGEWYSATDDSVGDFSAVAYYLARELRQDLEIPVGVIVSAANGSVAESWTSYSALQAEPVLSPFLLNWQNRIAAIPAEAFSKSRPSVFFNGMLAPLAPFPIQGVVWYQGESNVVRSSTYKTVLPILIADWRRLWSAYNPIPPKFYVVQLPNYGALDTQPGNSDLAELREAQQQTATQPGNSLVVTIDIGDPGDIHPTKKLDVAKRVSYAVLANTYGRSVEFAGPTLSNVMQEGSALRLSFDFAAGLKTTHEDPDSIPAFAIAGADRQWQWAQVQIDGEQILLTHPSIPEPVAARYGWSSNPQATVYNGSNLPMVPFRTDNWSGTLEPTP